MTMTFGNCSRARSLSRAGPSTDRRTTISADSRGEADPNHLDIRIVGSSKTESSSATSSRTSLDGLMHAFGRGKGSERRQIGNVRPGLRPRLAGGALHAELRPGHPGDQEHKAADGEDAFLLRQPQPIQPSEGSRSEQGEEQGR